MNHKTTIRTQQSQYLPNHNHFLLFVCVSSVLLWYFYQDDTLDTNDDRTVGETLGKVSRKAKGLLEFKPETERELIARLILEVEPTALEKEVPGLPAHLLFMAIRYVDNVNDERWLQSFLSNTINAIRKTVKVCFLSYVGTE